MFLLRLASLSKRQRETALRKRLFERRKGYDIHRSLKRMSPQHVVEGKPIVDLVRDCEDIKNVVERKITKNGLQKLGRWRLENPGFGRTIPPKKITSPNGIFDIQLAPGFSIERLRGRVGYHVWNTMRPDLDIQAAYSAIELLEQEYISDGDLKSFSILSLLIPRALMLPSHYRRGTANTFLVGFEREIERIRHDYRPPRRPEPRPDEQPRS